MIEIERFAPKGRAEWDRFIAEARNGVFLFHRDYMEYHADRFADHSLLFRSAGKLVAVLPASERGDEMVSHGGLTFGGIISGRRMTTPVMMDLFAALRRYLRERGFGRLIYKAVPHIYHDVPAEEDLYALFVNGARLVRRDVSSTIRMDSRFPVAKGRKSSVGVARKHGLTVGRSFDFHTFMEVEAEHLARRYGVKPVHTGDEMAMLAGHFPDAIKLFAALHGTVLVAGIVIYESGQVAHAQYIAATDRGKELSALDLVMHHLLNEYYREKRFFDFGISTEQEGRQLNSGLISYKESYGARATTYDFYELDADE
jgi:hypothetical protein